jgi:glycosyltransferase involved in cell wall biosynthesis
MIEKPMATISVIICTRNRGEFLRDTLESLAKVVAPKGDFVELIVVDNGSTDHTKEVVKQSVLSAFNSVTVVDEHRPGLSHARNTAVAAAEGDILLFTDDDVRVPKDWISGMVQPIRSGRADAVAGGVELAPHLQREWQHRDPELTSPLATTHTICADDPTRLVGANMAVARQVFEHVPAFAPELDAGSALGLGGDTLFSLQLQDAGFRLVAAFDVAVEHNCSPDRLSRASYLNYVEKVGRSEAYIDYHWRGQSVQPVRLCLGLIRRYARLVGNRIVLYRETQAQEGIPLWEFQLLMWIYYRRQLLAEWGNRRKFIGT